MTETQAKSGVAGASTAPDDGPVEAPQSAGTGGAETTAAGRPEAADSPRPAPASPASSGTSPGDAPSSAAKPEGTPGGGEPVSASPDGASSIPPAGAGYGPTAVNRPPVAPAIATAAVGRPAPAPVVSPGVKPPEPVAPSPISGARPPEPKPIAKVPEPQPVVKSSETTVRTAPPTSVPVVAVPPSTTAGAGAAAGSGVTTGSGVQSATGSHPVIATVSAPPLLSPPISAPAPSPASAPGALGPVPAAPVIARATVVGSGSTTLTRPAGPASATTAAVGAARVSDAVRTARATVAGAAVRGPRRARLHLKRIDPWSVMKFSFAVSLVLFVVAIVATSVLYLALDAMGVFSSVNKALSDMVGEANNADAFKITAKGVIGTSVLLGAVNMVLFTALATLAAFVYNVCADLVGGVELTLSEKD